MKKLGRAAAVCSAAIAALLAAPSSAQPPSGQDFDRGIDMRAVMDGLPPAPAPAGLELVMFREEADGVTLAFQDQRASKYTGGATRLIIAVKEDRGLRPDPVIFDIDIAQPVGPFYEFTFKDVQHKLRPGGKYYAVWSFQRQGPVSTEEVQRGGRSAALVLPSAQG
ncbi:MAG: hypothetical protein NTY77_09930 [Elusimicrobia bacterium]|nr:hypothetical protein [Elusimicrobiota bacterium]